MNDILIMIKRITASAQSHVGDLNRWSLSNNVPLFLCVSVISLCEKKKKKDLQLEKASEREEERWRGSVLR